MRIRDLVLFPFVLLIAVLFFGIGSIIETLYYRGWKLLAYREHWYWDSGWGGWHKKAMHQ